MIANDWIGIFFRSTHHIVNERVRSAQWAKERSKRKLAKEWNGWYNGNKLKKARKTKLFNTFTLCNQQANNVCICKQRVYSYVGLIMYDACNEIITTLFNGFFLIPFLLLSFSCNLNLVVVGIAFFTNTLSLFEQPHDRHDCLTTWIFQKLWPCMKRFTWKWNYANLMPSKSIDQMKNVTRSWREKQCQQNKT